MADETDDNQSKSDGYSGQYGLTDANSQTNAFGFLMWQALGEARTIVSAKVLSVTGGGLSAPATVNVQPMIDMVDGIGTSQRHGTVIGIPVVRWQSGSNAIILDPKVGDIGVLLVSDRDMSALKQNKDFSIPGSNRRFSLPDSIYLGTILGGAVTNHVMIADDKITIKAPVVVIDGDIQATGAISAAGEITAKAGTVGSVTLSEHQHTANNTPPTPGT